MSLPGSNINSESSCIAAGGSGYAYCPDTQTYYCCGTCTGQASCPSNSGLLNCACPKPLTNAEFNNEHKQLLEEKHQLTVNNIQELQEIEKFMYQNLEKLNSGGNSDVAQEEQVINRINELTQMRVGLFNQLKNMYTTSTTELTENRNALTDQIAMVGIVENELNKTKHNLRALENDRTNALRMVEIGTYQMQRYNAHTYIMKIIVITAVVVLAFSILLQKQLIPSKIAVAGITVTLTIALIILFRNIYDLFRRSNLVYDQYTWGFNKAELQPGYESVVKHDELFFSKLEGDIEGGYNQAKTDISKTMKGLTKLGNDLSSEASSLTAIPSSKPSGAQSSVSPSQPNIESFAPYY
jgi:hypothetical protein